MDRELVPRGTSGAPVAVPRAHPEQVARSRIDGYHQLDEETFKKLLDEVGPRGLGSTVLALLSGSTASTVLLGFLAYGVDPLVTLGSLTALAGGTWGGFDLERRRRQRRVVDVGLGLGLTGRFAERLSRDLELMKGWLPKEERPGPLASWPTERDALIRALSKVRDTAAG